MNKKILITEILLIVFLSCSFAYADKWGEPQTKKFNSDNSKFYFLMRPNDKSTLFNATDNSPIWSRKLPNIPITILISDDGKYVVTLDTWGHIGYGDMVVIYNADGEIIERYSLEDFLSKDQIYNLPHSVSSIHWGKGDLDNERKVLILHFAKLRGNIELKDIEIDLRRCAPNLKQTIYDFLGIYKLDLKKTKSRGESENIRKNIRLIIKDDGSIIYGGGKIHNLKVKKNFNNDKKAILVEEFTIDDKEYKTTYILELTDRHLVLYKEKDMNKPEDWNYFIRN